MTKQYNFLVLFLLIISSSIHAQVAGSQLWYSGFNVGISSQGYGGIGAKDSGFYNLINPAASATTDNIRFFASGNIYLPEWGGSFGISTPITAGGVLYTASQHLSIDQTTLAQIGYGKKVRSDFAIGFEGLISINSTSKRNIIGGGFSFGVLWLPKDFAPLNNGWGFVDFSLGGVLKTVFFPTGGTCFNYTPEMLWQFGIEATFMKYQHARWKLILDYTLGFVPLVIPNTVNFQTWVSFGTTWTFWNIWDISVGTILGNNGLGFGADNILPFTLGTALGYEWNEASFKVSYSFGAQKLTTRNREYIHTIGLEIGIGASKSTNMQVVLGNINSKEITNYFSPNNDNVNDTVTLLPAIIGSEPINSWELVIKNDQGITVRTIASSDESFTQAQKVFYNFFVPTKSQNIPQHITWDGKNNNNQIAIDGIYLATLNIRYNETESLSSSSKIIVLDTEIPSAILHIDKEKQYIYLGDDASTSLDIEQTLSSQDPWIAKLIDNEDGKIIEEWLWKAGNTPLTNSWKLKNSKRINVATGTFSYIVCSYDKAGNFNKVSLTNITIETSARKPTLSAKISSFSPNDDGILDIIDIQMTHGGTNGLISSSFTVYNQGGEKVYTESLDIANLPYTIKWDGFNEQKKIVDDGDYLIILEKKYVDKTEIISNPLLIKLDTTPPNFNVDFSPKLFSPDNDGINDTLKIDFFAEDIHNISNWTINIRNDKKEILHSLNGDSKTIQLTWKPSQAQQVISSEILTFDLEIYDTLGNVRKTPFHNLRLDILTDNDDQDLIIAQTTACFPESRGILSGSLFTYADEMWSYIQHYPEYLYTIKTFAYPMEANNDTTESYKLALMRSESLKQYLINKGVNSNNIDIEVDISDEKNPEKQSLLRQPKMYVQKSSK